MLREIDAFAEEKGYTRSGLIVRAARTLMERGAKSKSRRGKALDRV
jgi:metal-responsive CopG/Arc/MetJ family transcriptional regulator